MTKSRRLFSWSVLCLGLLGLGAWIWTQRSFENRRLPALKQYESLPEKFNQTLGTTYQRATALPADPENIRKLARLFHANRLYAEAIQCYGALSADGQALNARDHYYLADVAQNEGDLEKAEKELSTSVQKDPRYPAARLAWAGVLFKLGREGAAAKQYTELLSIEQNNPQAMLGLARIKLQQNNDEAALSDLEHLVATHPESTSGTALLAQILDRRGQTGRAAQLTQRSRQRPEPIPPDLWLDELMTNCFDVQLLAFKSEEYLRTGQMDRATLFLRRLEELDPQGWFPQLLKGWTRAQAGRYNEAVVEYRAALSKGGGPEQICPLLVSSLLAMGKTSEAVTLTEEYYVKMPDSIPLLTLYAEVIIRAHDDPKAKRVLRTLLEKEPYLYTPNMSLSKILWDSGEKDESAKCLERVASVFANDVPSRALLGRYYLEKADPLSAIPPLEQASLQPIAQKEAREELRLMLDRAYLLAARNELEKGRSANAIVFYDKAIASVPNNLDAYAGKATAYAQLKQFAAAKEALLKLREMQPTNPTIFLSLGDLEYQDGDALHAREHWKQAIQLTSPSDRELREALQARLAGNITAETFK